MKIYILDIDKKLQPANQPFKYPSHNDDYGIEQDFLSFLKKHPVYVTADHKEADYHYLPVFWTRWHLAHDYGKTGLAELQSSVNAALVDDKKTFTVCQYDDGPVADLGNSKVFLGSRKDKNGYDAPLLCSKHKFPFFIPSKKYLASFAGRIATHPIREELFALLKNDKRFIFSDADRGERFFVKTMLRSYVCLSPRGYGGSSFRFYEAMQLGVVPFLLGDIDTRPFKRSIPWDELSFYSENAAGALSVLNSKSEKELLEMGKNCRQFFDDKLYFQKWCNYLIKELQTI